MVDERANRDYGRDGNAADDVVTNDGSTMSEGVGGLSNLDDDERATVGDVDGDNVRGDEEINP